MRQAPANLAAVMDHYELERYSQWMSPEGKSRLAATARKGREQLEAPAAVQKVFSATIFCAELHGRGN